MPPPEPRVRRTTGAQAVVTSVARGGRRTRRFLEILVQAILRHSVIDLGAQLAYWSLLALFPFAIFLLTVIGYLPLQHLDQQIITWLAPFMPDAALRLVWETAHEVLGRQRGGLLTIALVGALWSAAGGAGALTVALNRAYGVPETRSYLRRKGHALVATLAATVLLVIAVAGATIGPHVVHRLLAFLGIEGSYGGFAAVWAWLRWPLSIAALVGVLAAVYSLLPDVQHGFHLVSAGSFVAVGSWLLVTWTFRVFVGYIGGYARTYGALGAVIMLMTWIYLSGITIIVGAEVNAAWGRLKQELHEGDPST
jgi:membrane protein